MHKSTSGIVDSRTLSELNDRRLDLIDRKYTDGFPLSVGEEAELNWLQEEVGSRVAELTSNPSISGEQIDSLLDALEEKLDGPTS